MVFSEDVGLGKPSEKIFMEACRRAQCDPAECVHVGDDLVADVGASHALGMQAVWLDRAEIRDSEIPARRITTLLDLSLAEQSQRTRRHTNQTVGFRIPS
jgi:putative hydrolase of the HAD superfamily